MSSTYEYNYIKSENLSILFFIIFFFRFAYSRICTDLASHGFIVLASEHREGSSCVSYHLDEGQKQLIHHRRIQEFEKVIAYFI